MIDKLHELLPVVLEDLQKKNYDEWDTLVINRRKPHTYRISKMYGDYRICLHNFVECEEDEAFAHPHPWPGAFLLLSGEYYHRLARSKNAITLPTSYHKQLLRANSMYEITHPLEWHSVQPLVRTMTIMINGKPWTAQHVETRTTKGKDLEKMERGLVVSHCCVFENLITEYVRNYL